MADYKVVFRADRTDGPEKVLWEPGCPIALEAVQVSRNVQTSEAYLQIKVRNVSGEMLNAVNGTAAIGYADGSSGEIDFEDLDLDLAPGNQKPLKAIALPRGDVEAASARITQAAQPSGKWKASGEPAGFPERAALELGEKAMTERKRILSEAGIDARAYGASVQDCGDWWVCACGQVNVKSERCCECGATKAILQSVEDEQSLLASADEWSESVYQRAVGLASKEGDIPSLAESAKLFGTIKDWEDSSERLAAVEAQIEQLRKRASNKTTRIVGIVAAIAVAAVAITLFVVNVAIPNAKYDEAMGLVEAGQYDEAIVVLQELDGYKDSADQITRAEELKVEEKKNSDYERALAYIETGNYNEAIRILESLGDYKDSPEQLARAEEGRKEVIYQGALASIRNGDYATGIDALESLGDYKDSIEQLTRTKQAYMATANVGDIITFAEYNGESIRWLVLAKENGQMLLVSEQIIDQVPFNDAYSTDATWENCSLRAWLNGDFFNTVFSADEQAFIATTTLPGSTNPDAKQWSGHKSSPLGMTWSASTEDRVFILSLEEVNLYLGGNKKNKTATCTATAERNGVYRNADGYGYYYLRTPGNGIKSGGSYYVSFVGADGKIGSSAYASNNNGWNNHGFKGSEPGVRPAIWVNLE